MSRARSRARQTELAGKVILIVGASSGIGRQFAVRTAEAGATVIATARREGLLEDLAAEITTSGGSCTAIPADGLDAAAAARVVSDVAARFGRIDVVLLNAGGAPALDMTTISAATVTDYMRSNYDVLVHYLVPVLDQMRSQGSGVVMHTNSLAGFLGVPLQGPYSAAKGALRLLIDTCRIEFEPFGISFVSVYPGFVATAKSKDDGMPTPGEISEEEAADHLVKALVRGKRDYLFPWTTALQIRVGSIVPKRVLNVVLRRMILEQAPGRGQSTSSSA